MQRFGGNRTSTTQARLEDQFSWLPDVYRLNARSVHIAKLTT